MTLFAAKALLFCHHSSTVSVRSMRGYGQLCGRKNAPAVSDGIFAGGRRSICMLTLNRVDVKSEASAQCASLTWLLIQKSTDQEQSLFSLVHGITLLCRYTLTAIFPLIFPSSWTSTASCMISKLYTCPQAGTRYFVQESSAFHFKTLDYDSRLRRRQFVFAAIDDPVGQILK